MEKKTFGKKYWCLILLLIGILAVSMVFWVSSIHQIKREQSNMKLVLYEGPKTLLDASEEDLKASSETQRDITLKHCIDTQVQVNGQECYVYDTNVNHTRQWVSNYLPPLSRTPITYFDFEGKADITVTVPDIDIQTVKVSPQKEEIRPVVDVKKNTVTFSVTQPGIYTVEFNDSPERALHIFANEIEAELPDFSDENLIYIGPGEWDIGAVSLESGQTLYIAGGAVVHGSINANFANDVTVMGHGIIDGSFYEGWQGQTAYIPLKFDHCTNVIIKDVIVLNSNAWVCQEFDTKESMIDGVKIISARPNGDGITLQSCQNVEVKNCFVRSWDDSLVVKNYDENSSNISFSNMQLWTDFAQSMEVGYETNKGEKENASITDVKFSDICVLHNYHKPVISVHNADDAAVSHITFSDITVEDAQMGSGDGDEMPYLIDLNIAQNSNWSSTKNRGTISDVRIENVSVLSGKFCASRISGFDEEHKISGVEISNLTILGTKIRDFEEGKFEIDGDTTANLSIE